MSTRGLVTDYYFKKEESLKELYSLLKVGDLLEFPRLDKYINHWAVYIGEEEFEGVKKPCVIHRIRKKDQRDDQKKPSKLKMFFNKRNKSKDTGGIFRAPIESIIENDFVRINNQLDKIFEPKSPNEIVGRAKFLMKVQGRSYNLIINNCEHFANSCRYGRHQCHQVVSVSKTSLRKVAVNGGGIVTSHIVIGTIVGAVGLGAGPIFWAIFGSVALTTAIVVAVLKMTDMRKEKKALTKTIPRMRYSSLNLKLPY